MQAGQRTVGLGLALALAAGMTPAQQTPPAPAPLIHHTFETDPAEWTGFGMTAMVSLTHDAAHVKQGQGALQFDYAATKGELNALVLPTPNSVLTKMKSLHFWIRADYPTVLAVSLQEKDVQEGIAGPLRPRGPLLDRDLLLAARTRLLLRSGTLALPDRV